jgi:hypothetical protein
MRRCGFTIPNLSPGEVEIVDMLDGGPVVLYNAFLALHS